MSKADGILHKEVFSGDLILKTVAVFFLAVGLVFPLWGLMVIVFDFTVVFLPVIVLAALGYAVYAASLHRKKGIER